MKKISVIGLFITGMLSLHTQHLFAQDALFISNSGNVGVGVSDPVNKLQMGGNIHMDGNPIYFGKGPTNKYDVILRNDSTDRIDIGGLNGVTLGYTNGNSKIKPAFTINTTGKVELGTINKRAPQSALNVYGNIGLTGTHIIFDSKNGVIDWGDKDGGTLHFRTLRTQGSDTGKYYDQMLLKSSVSGEVKTTELEVLGAVKAESIEIKNSSKSISRRDWRPYGTPSYYWGGTVNETVPQNKMALKGRANFDKDWIDKPYNGKRMIGFKDLSKESQVNNTPPDNGVYLTIPATAGCINSLLLSTLDDRWSTCSVWLCKNTGSMVKLQRSSNNANGVGANAFTHTIGPNNTFKEFASHAWMTFPITKQQAKDYLNSDGTLKFLITTGPESDGILYISGIALVPNPNGFNQQTAVSLHWGLNGNNKEELKWNGNFINEGLASLDPQSSKSIYIKVIDPDKDLLVTFYEVNDNEFRGAVNVTVGSSSAIFYPSPGITGIASTLYRASQSLRPVSFIVPAAIVKYNLEQKSSGVPNVIKLNISNPGLVSYYLYGVDTEIY